MRGVSLGFAIGSLIVIIFHLAGIQGRLEEIRDELHVEHGGQCPRAGK